MGPLGCPETPVKDYHSKMHNIPEARRSQRECSIIKLKIFFGTVIDCDSQRVAGNIYVHQSIQMVLTFQIHPGTIKRIQSDIVAKANTAGK
jgi:hypothetical protein